jgi:glycosyltransferase involved in cell wall biosynthesis
MAIGLPIVATAVGAAPDLLTHGRDALLVEPLKPSDLFDALERLRNDSELRYRLATNAQQIAATQSWDQLRARYVREIELDDVSRQSATSK